MPALIVSTYSWNTICLRFPRQTGHAFRDMKKGGIRISMPPFTFQA
ncbi:hypothetical protein GJA_477 [Janthinobacterium agaricidamnosum NBRC 102515 = DSM 9628]|uniref:Uncharacterized protein n=1 Tax=Janthinobacterium agaricidamnosum NBRC 102515 = DSM 9628 TaxID=1349767 RepID=W0V1I2_9BURK|nr:hypothetical protein GJA_477 [Janthinobacterium agaricidamnosum NBRC 102515 = DSM 9628]